MTSKKQGIPSWHEVANLIVGKNTRQCQYRYTRILQPKLNVLEVEQKQWTLEEDTLLCYLVKQNGVKEWKKVCELMNTNTLSPTRRSALKTNLTCRERYM